MTQPEAWLVTCPCDLADNTTSGCDSTSDAHLRSDPTGDLAFYLASDLARGVTRTSALTRVPRPGRTCAITSDLT